MKTLNIQLFIGVFALLLSLQVDAQDKPAASPLGKAYQRLGVTDVEITYSRPGVKGRDIFAANGLVPYGKLWRTGANLATKISFSTDVMVGGKKVKAGEYAVFSIPGKEEWTFILNTVTDQGGTGNYDEGKDALRITVPAQEYPGPVETMTFVFGNVKDTSADLAMIWENTAVMVPISVEKTW